MARFTVCLVETREYFLEVDADTADEAREIATDSGPEGAVRDQPRKQFVEWVAPL